MSHAHTWFGSVIATPRKRYGYILCPGAAWLVPGRGTSASIPITRISRYPLAIDAAAFLVELKRYPPRAEERQFQMQFVDPAHQRQIVRLRHGMGAVDSRARHVQQRALPANR